MSRLIRVALLIIVTLAGCMTEEATTATPDLTSSSTPTPESIVTPLPGAVQTRATDGMEMVYVPGGEFMMGSDDEEIDYAMSLCSEYSAGCSRSWFSGEAPAHAVVLDGYWLDKTEVTNGQYEHCVEAGNCELPECSGGTDLPVVCVTWQQAMDYCTWVGGRLPTEAEWEYAARGPEGLRFPWGDEFDGSLLNYCDANCELAKRDGAFDDGYVQSAPVGSYPGGASWIGVLDMAGNVWEWVNDWYGSYSAEVQINPIGPASGDRKVARGGSWNASRDHVRGALRNHAGTNETINHIGFRCTAPPDPGKAF